MSGDRQAAQPTPGPSGQGFAPAGRALAAVLLATALWDAWGLARHAGFQPAETIRVAAPIVALLLGGAFTQLVARSRARIDGERDVDRGGKALFMGFVMVAATILAWLLVSQAIPATLTTLAGTPRTEPGMVARKVPETSDADCRFRLEVRSAAEAGAVPRALDECVDETLWRQAVASAPVTLQLVGGALGAELVGVSTVGAAR